MFQLGRLYHLTHVVTDVEAADTWYDDVFEGLHVKRGGDANRFASFVVIGDLILEAMRGVDSPDGRPTALGRFLERFGPHLHSLAMFVDDLEETVRTLQKCGIRCLDIEGAPVSPGGMGDTKWIWTHPKDTRAQFEFAEVPDFHYDPRLHPGWSGDFWRDHPLGIESCSHITVLMRDLESAPPIYQGALGGRLLYRKEADDHRSEFYGLGPEVVVEVRQPTHPDSFEAQDLERSGEGIFGFTFRVRDLERVEIHLKSKHQAIGRSDPDGILLAPQQAFGLGVGFTTSAIPNDPRG